MREIKFRAWNKELRRMVNKLNLNFEKDDNHVLMQYTGLKDKNGKEIYEGDLVKLMEWKSNPDIYKVHPITYKIDWDECGARFHMYSPDELWGKLPNGKERETDEGIEIFRDFSSEEQIIEIIGNIYENPELLK